ncbi:MAG: methyl-accepting chemotaxis sensory transducer [Paenibacillus sp.]|nr:methyl-accepting chemotaxis sensory transducer [Paenibacillus sp.]
MKSSIHETSNQVGRLLLNADRDLYQANAAYLLIESGALEGDALKAMREDMVANKDQAIERVTEATALMETAGLLDLDKGDSAEKVGDLLSSFDDNYKGWFAAASAATDDGKALAVNPEVDSLFLTARTGVDEIGQNVEVFADEKMEEIESGLDSSQLFTFVGIIVVTVSLIAMLILMTRSMTSTIRRVLEKTNQVSQGDLTAPRAAKYGKDELGRILHSVDDMIERMNGLISGVVRNASDVKASSARLSQAASESATASEHVASQIAEVTQNSEIQARSAEETSRAIEEMTVGISRIAENTSTLADHSSSTSSEAEEGREALERLEDRMRGMVDVIHRLSAIIETLEKRSGQIGSIAENITTFSNQTNILSLNASIEAARAGEHGKGFAVVAGEIRKLAASSLASAEGINDLVNVTRGEIASASDAMRQTLVEVEDGGNRVAELNRRLNAISAAVNQMTEQLQESSAITEQMSASSEEVSASSEQSAATASASLEKTESVAAATEEQLALTDSIADASRTLDSIVDQLGAAVGRFKVKQ